MKPTIQRTGPALTLAQRIYAFKGEGEAWTTAVDRYARDVLFRHPRTVHRWLTGESPIPAVVASALTARYASVAMASFEDALASGDTEELPPYPFCRTPEKCKGKGYCPADPSCDD